MPAPLFPPGPRLPAALQSAWLAYRTYRFLECRILSARVRAGDPLSDACPLVEQAAGPG